MSLTKRLQGDRGQHTHGPRRKFDKDRQSCPSYWHCGVVRINGHLWRVEKEKSARKRKWKFTVEIFTPFDVNMVKIWTFLTFNARNIFCFGIKGIPSSIYEIGDRYESFATVGEIRAWWRADFQSGSRVLKKVF